MVNVPCFGYWCWGVWKHWRMMFCFVCWGVCKHWRMLFCVLRCVQALKNAVLFCVLGSSLRTLAVNLVSDLLWSYYCLKKRDFASGLNVCRTTVTVREKYCISWRSAFERENWICGLKICRQPILLSLCMRKQTMVSVLAYAKINAFNLEHIYISIIFSGCSRPMSGDLRTWQKKQRLPCE